MKGSINLPDQGLRLSVRKGFPGGIHRNDLQCSTQPWDSENHQDQQPDETCVDRNIRDLKTVSFTVWRVSVKGPLSVRLTQTGTCFGRMGVEAQAGLVSISIHMPRMEWITHLTSALVCAAIVSAAEGGAPVPPGSPAGTQPSQASSPITWKNLETRVPGAAVDLSLGTNHWTVRWVPPGRFMMGSPVDEANRDKDEVQHEVEFSRGFFMAETECTQAQWEGILSTNPSHGKAPNQPVNQVN